MIDDDHTWLANRSAWGIGAAFLEGMVAGHIVGGAVLRSKIRTAAAVQAANPLPRERSLNRNH